MALDGPGVNCQKVSVLSDNRYDVKISFLTNNGVRTKGHWVLQ